MNSMNKGIEMNHISLKKVTLLVSTCVLASYFVSADEKVTSLNTPTIEAVSAKVASDSLSIAIKDIPALLTKFDSNKNGYSIKLKLLQARVKCLLNTLKTLTRMLMLK